METASLVGGSKRVLLEEEPKPLRDSLLGLTAIHQGVVLLEYGHVIVRRGYQDLDKVRLLSGGIAGTDLCHAIFVGKGMLTAAVLGDETAPSSRQILRTIEELSTGENCGIFVIAQANPELFNFALAAERANADCRRRVKLLTIDDDTSDAGVRERNSCGFVLLTKILGALAEKGATFSDILQCYKDSIHQRVVTVPLNYHEGEFGRTRRKSVRLDTKSFDSNCRHIIDKKSQSKLDLHPSIPTVALINTSKDLTRLEELGFVKQVLERLRQLGVCVVRLYLGNFVKAAPGRASLTVLKVFDNKLIEYLDAPCEALVWQHCVQIQPEVGFNNEIPGCLKKRGPKEIALVGPKLSTQLGNVLTQAVQFACDALISCERQLNIIDAEKSASNVGTRLKTMAENVNKRLNDNQLPVNCPHAFLKKLSIIIESAVGGTMGSIYGILLESAAGVFGDLPEIEPVVPTMWAKALTVGVRAVKRYCSSDKQKTTMYYPLKACQTTVTKEMAKDTPYIECFCSGVSMAEEAAEKTQVAPHKYADAGAHAVGIWMRALYEAVKLYYFSTQSSEKMS